MSELVLKKAMTREGPLMLFEIWSRGSELAGRDLGVPSEPRTIEFLVNRDGLVSDFFHPDADIEYNKALLKKVSEDPAYAERAFREYNNLLERLQTTLVARPHLTRKQLLHFFDKAVRAWVGLLLSYQIPMIPEMPKEIRKKALAFRKKGEKFFRNIQEVIEKSLRNLYPKEPNADEIAYEELVSQRVPSAETLAARQHLYVVAAGVVHPVTDLAPFLKKQGIALDEGTATEGAAPAELKGSVASKGVARGRIRRVMRKKEISAFQDGEILVTSMTTPEFVPAMKKAAAIVTDEGGITCHAAIISRELGKPCIIGTKVATKVLKDGDEVEVDAEKGVVRVLAKRP